MVKVSLAELDRRYAEEQKQREVRVKQNETKFIPMEGESYDVFVFPDDPDEVQENQWTFYQFRVKHGEKEKYWKLFLNQVMDLKNALKNHPNRMVHVVRGKGSKKIVIS